MFVDFGLPESRLEFWFACMRDASSEGWNILGQGTRRSEDFDMRPGPFGDSFSSRSDGMREEPALHFILMYRVLTRSSSFGDSNVSRNVDTMDTLHEFPAIRVPAAFE